MNIAGSSGRTSSRTKTSASAVNTNIEWNTIQGTTKTTTMDGNTININNSLSIYNNHSLVDEAFSPPSSLVLTAALMLIEGAAGDGVCGSSYDDSTVEDALSRRLMFSPSDISNVDNKTNDNVSIKSPKNPPTEYVYLLPRPWLHNWIKWAAAQPVPGCEAERLKIALKTACEVHELRVPPSCGGEEQYKAGVRELPHVGMDSRRGRRVDVFKRDKSGM